MARFEKGNTASVGNKGGGRKSEYREEYAAQATKLCLLGATDEQLANFFEVTVQTINKWKRQFPDFRLALKEGKEGADAQIAKALFHRALGYNHKAQKIMQYEGSPVIVDYIEQYPPDTTAGIFWLKNRRPDLWRDRPNQNENPDDVAPTSVNVKVVDASTPDDNGNP